MGDLVFVAVVVAIIFIGPLSPVAFGFYWLAGCFVVFAVVGRGAMRLHDWSYLRQMRKLQEQNELHFKQLEEARRRELALREPDWEGVDRILGTSIAAVAARERALKLPHQETHL